MLLLIREYFGKLFGDKGYLSSELFRQFYEQGVKLITKLQASTKNKLMDTADKILLKSRGVIENVNNCLKNVCQIEHRRHKSSSDFLGNLLTGLIAYRLETRNPAGDLSRKEKISLPQSAS